MHDGLPELRHVLPQMRRDGSLAPRVHLRPCPDLEEPAVVDERLPRVSRPWEEASWNAAASLRDPCHFGHHELGRLQRPFPPTLNRAEGFPAKEEAGEGEVRHEARLRRLEGDVEAVAGVPDVHGLAPEVHRVLFGDEGLLEPPPRPVDELQDLSGEWAHHVAAEAEALQRFGASAGAVGQLHEGRVRIGVGDQLLPQGVRLDVEGPGEPRRRREFWPRLREDLEERHRRERGEDRRQSVSTP